MRTGMSSYRAAAVLMAAVFVIVYAMASRQFTLAGATAGGDIKMTSDAGNTDKDWQEQLTPEQYRVLRQCGTERPFTGKYWDHKAEGVYKCAGCGQTLFRSDDKFKSGSGWPSFTRPDARKSVAESADRSLGMVRTEVKCSRCGGHLGHVFPDGPKPTGLRYCINSAALDFSEKTEADDPKSSRKSLQTATFGAGCFWCVEAAFEMVNGVKSVKSGYMGGNVKDPTYKQVCSGRTGHAEVARVTYDPETVSFEKLLDIFWVVHDPTTLNKQGADIGTQYRSAIFYHTPEQKAAAEKAVSRLEKSGRFKSRIVTEVTAASEFYEAEDYHQDYYSNNSAAPYCRAVIAPKLEKVRAATRGDGRH